MAGKSIHRKSLEILVRKPEIIGIKPSEILIVSVEPLLYGNRRQIIEPDLVYQMRDGGVIVVEYKSTNQPRLLGKGTSQLAKAMNYFSRMGVPSKGFLITGDDYPELRSSKSRFPGRNKNKQPKPNRIFTS